MNEYRRQGGSDWCPPPPRNPADQPKNPKSCKCDPWPLPEFPKPPEPTPCDPGHDCNCPTPPSSNPSCLDDMDAKLAGDIAAGKNAEALKASLDKIRENAKKAALSYTRKEYDSLIDLWKKNDDALVDLIRKVVCNVPCWKCVLECYVCPKLDELRRAEELLYGGAPSSANIANLKDLLHWHVRNREIQTCRFDRVAEVLKAWSDPAKIIGANLALVKSMIDAATAILQKQEGQVVYDVFLRIIPMHLAVAPPESSGVRTNVGIEYTEFCKCDDVDGREDYCCGPNTGEMRMRDRLIGPQPYLIDPNQYFELVCCIVEKRYGPAKDAQSQAQAEVIRIESQIAALKARVDTALKEGGKAFDAEAKGSIPADIDCCDHENATTPDQSRSA